MAKFIRSPRNLQHEIRSAIREKLRVTDDRILEGFIHAAAEAVEVFIIRILHNTGHNYTTDRLLKPVVMGMRTRYSNDSLRNEVVHDGYVCAGCRNASLHVLNNFCPNCGRPIVWEYPKKVGFVKAVNGEKPDC